MIGDSHNVAIVIYYLAQITWYGLKLKNILLWLSPESDLGLVRNDYMKVNRVQRHLVIHC